MTFVLPLDFAIPVAFNLSALIGLPALGTFDTGICCILHHSHSRAGGVSLAGGMPVL